MAEGNERVQARLENIQSVKPILEALRTISLGNWQSALKKQQSVRAFAQNYFEILSMVAPAIQSSLQQQKRRKTRPESDAIQPVILVAVGSERGLCGSYNHQLIHALRKEFDQPEEKPRALWLFGTRLYRMAKQAGLQIAWWQPLSSTSLPEYAAIHRISRQWLRAYEGYQLDQVDLISHHYLGTGKSEVKKDRLLPYSVDFQPDVNEEAVEIGFMPILETDPLKLYQKVVEQMGTMQFYLRILEAAAVENSTRYQLMEEASQNAGRMVEEMTEIMQMYRREAITQEMQELASGAGLLGGR